MDGLVRYHRMSGNDTVFIPGTDHAGIATQIVVERQLDAQRFRATTWAAKFVEKVWEWKEKVRQHDHRTGPPPGRVRRLAARVLHHGRAHVARVVETFVRLHKQGLIYRGKRLVNWDPNC